MAFLGALGTIAKVASIGAGIAGTAAQVSAQKKAAAAQDRAHQFNTVVARRNAANDRASAQMDFLLQSHEIKMNRAANEANYAFEQNRLAWARYENDIQTKIQTELHTANARAAEIEAAQAAQRTNEQQRRLRDQAEQRMAIQRARAGASGVIGPIAILGQESEERALMEMTDNLYRGNLERHGHLEEARVEKWRSKFAQARGELTKRNIGFDDFAAKIRFSMSTMRLNLEESANKARLASAERTYKIREWSAMNAPNPSGATRAAARATAIGGVGDAIGSFASLSANTGSNSRVQTTYYNTELTSPNVAFPVNSNQPTIPPN